MAAISLLRAPETIANEYRCDAFFTKGTTPGIKDNPFEMAVM